MKDEKVIHWMSTNLVTIEPRTTLPEAYKLMRKFGIRRLPVIDYGKLVGIITLGDIREAKPSQVTSLSIYELNYLLSQLKIERIMSPDPITLSSEATIGQAAKLMYEHKIGSLPVIEADHLIGLITESDIFRVIARGVGEIPPEIATIPKKVAAKALSGARRQNAFPAANPYAKPI
jgi:CBS domain-containing protein